MTKKKKTANDVTVKTLLELLDRDQACQLDQHIVDKLDTNTIAIQDVSFFAESFGECDSLMEITEEATSQQFENEVFMHLDVCVPLGKIIDLMGEGAVETLRQELDIVNGRRRTLLDKLSQLTPNKKKK